MKLLSKFLLLYLAIRYIYLSKKFPRKIKLTSYWGICIIDNVYYVYENKLSVVEFTKHDKDKLYQEWLVSDQSKEIIWKM